MSDASKAVFLSYASQDADAARRICDALRAAGVEVWFDQSELRGGDAWDQKIRRQIKECALFLAVISANTDSRPKGYFRREWKLAVDGTRDLADDVPFIVPIAIDATMEAMARVPEKFLDVQWSRLPDGHVMPEFIAHLTGLLGVRSAVPLPASEAPNRESVEVGTDEGGSAAVAVRPSPILRTGGSARPVPSEPYGPAAANARRRRRVMPRAIVGAAIAAIAVLVAWYGRTLLPSSASEPRTRWMEIGPPHRTFGVQAAPSVSPDGEHVAFWAPDESGKIWLWIRPLSSALARILPGSSQSHRYSIPAFWAPDGRSLGFFADGKLKRIDLAGGNPLTLADAANPRGGTWNRDGVIVFVPASGKPVHRVSASGGQPAAVNVSSREYDKYAWPHFLPDGQHFFVIALRDGQIHLLVASLENKEARVVAKIGSRVEYSKGRIFFGRGESLFAQGFDERAFTLAGTPVRIAENLGHSFGDLSSFAFSVAQQGATIVCWSGSMIPVTQLTWFSRAGQRLGTVGDPGVIVGFTAAPSFQHAVVERHDRKANEVKLWLVDAATNMESMFSSSVADRGQWTSGTPVWPRTGDRVLFATFPGIAAQSLSGGGAEKLFDGWAWLNDVSTDGRHALVTIEHPETGTDIWLAALEGRTLEPYLVTKSSESVARFSPDNRHVAYTSDESGQMEVYIQSFPRPSRPIRVSREGGVRPEWRPDGKELYYLDPERRRLMAVTIESSGPPIQVSSPQSLFSVEMGSDWGRQQYQPTGDGTRFLINNVVEDSAPRLISVILNWTAPTQ